MPYDRMAALRIWPYRAHLEQRVPRLVCLPPRFWRSVGFGSGFGFIALIFDSMSKRMGFDLLYAIAHSEQDGTEYRMSSLAHSVRQLGTGT